jgi:hypothetical protein
MSAAAMNPPVDAEALIARAKAILAEKRAMTPRELQDARDGLYRLNEGSDRLAFATLTAIYHEVDRAADARLAEYLAARQAEAQAKLDAHAAARPARWAALSRTQRAAYLICDELGGTGNPLARAFMRFATMLEDDSTATKVPPQGFEPERY